MTNANALNKTDRPADKDYTGYVVKVSYDYGWVEEAQKTLNAMYQSVARAGRDTSGIAQYCGEVRQGNLRKREEEMLKIFGTMDLRCVHCGQRNLRYLRLVQTPAGDRQMWGQKCGERAGLDATAVDEKLARDRAEREAEMAQTNWRKMEAAAENPDAAWLLDNYEGSSNFINDVKGRYDSKGYLSERQAEAVLNAYAKGVEIAISKVNRRFEDAEAGPAPIGDGIEVEGTVLTVKEYDSQYGVNYKFLVKLDNGSKVWSTIPKMSNFEWGWEARNIYDRTRMNDPYADYAEAVYGLFKLARVRFTANFIPGRDGDPTFSIAKRPRKAVLVEN